MFYVPYRIGCSNIDLSLMLHDLCAIIRNNGLVYLLEVVTVTYYDIDIKLQVSIIDK